LPALEEQRWAGAQVADLRAQLDRVLPEHIQATAERDALQVPPPQLRRRTTRPCVLTTLRLEF
jgi:hypothetical protein